MIVFQFSDRTYSWLDELDPSAQASNTRCESAISKRSTPRNGRKPTKHTGSSTGGHAYGKKHNLYTKYAQSVFILTLKKASSHLSWRQDLLQISFILYCSQNMTNVMRTDKHAACMEQIRNANKTFGTDLNGRHKQWNLCYHFFTHLSKIQGTEFNLSNDIMTTAHGSSKTEMIHKNNSSNTEMKQDNKWMP